MCCLPRPLWQPGFYLQCTTLLQALLSKPLRLLRLLPCTSAAGAAVQAAEPAAPVDLVKFWVRSRLAATQRARERLWRDQRLSWGTLVPDGTMALLLGLVGGGAGGRKVGWAGRKCHALARGD